MSYIEKLSNELINNEIFTKECLDLIDEIWKDKQINIADIPYFVSLITIFYYKNPIKNIKKENVKDVFKNFLIKLLQKANIFELLTKETIDMIETLISSSLDIVFLNVKSLFSKCCKCKKQNNEEEIIDNIKSSLTKNKNNENNEIKIDSV